LVALETATGKQLWQRFDLPPAARLDGDAQQIYLFEPGSQRMEVLRALDGKTVSQHALEVPPEAFLLQAAGRALVADQRDGKSRLRQLRLDEARVEWERVFAAGAHPFPLDRETVGVLEPTGVLKWLALRDGRLLGTAAVDMPEKLIEIYVHGDRQQFYVVLTGPAADPLNGQLGPNQVRGGFRNPIVNGTLHALDRRRGELIWKRRLRDAVFPLDQPREAPFLVLNYWQYRPVAGQPADAAPAVQGVLRCLDRLTGEDRYYDSRPDLHVYYALETNLEQNWVELRLATHSVRLDFTETGAPLPAWDGDLPMGPEIAP
jgi:hypothetical protein